MFECMRAICTRVVHRWVVLEKVLACVLGCFEHGSSLVCTEWLKALVWFWWIDETLSANLVYLSDHEIGSTIPSVEQMVKIMMLVMIKCLDLKKKKEKNKQLKTKVISIRVFVFWWSRHLVGVITFRIDSRTIKRGETRIEMRLSKCH